MGRQVEKLYDFHSDQWKEIISKHDESNPMPVIYGGQADHGLAKKQKLYYAGILCSFIPE